MKTSRFSLLALGFLFILMSTGCKKDIVELNDVPDQVISKKSESIGILLPKVSPDGRSNVSYYQGVNLKEKNFEVYLLAQEKLRNISNDGRSTMLQIDSIDFESCNVIQDSTETIYSCLIRTSIDSAFYNLIIEDSSGMVYGPYVLEYVMDSTFRSNLIAGTVDMSSFEGSMAKYTLDALFTPFAGGPDSRDCTHEECWELIFGGYGSGSGSSSGGLSPGTGVFSPSSGSTSQGGGQTETWCVRTGSYLNGYMVVHWTWIGPCDEDPPFPPHYAFTGTDDDSRGCDEEECLRFFPNLGFPVNDPFEDAGQVTPPIDPFLECQENALDFSKDHCGLRTRSKANGVDLSSFCMDGGGFDAQSALMAVMGLTTEQQTWLASNPTLFNDVVAFLDDKCWDEGSVDYVMYMINEMAQGAAYKFERVIELYNLIESNPDLLYDCVQEPYQVSFWSDLASFIPGSSVIEKLQNTPGNWNVQEISSAAGTKVNLDYFSVIIQDLPYLNGQQLSGDQLLQHIRLNLNDFVDNSIASFYPYNSNEEALWQSTNPLSAIITISMTDDGSVVCSEYQSCCWIFTTLDAPEDGAHPVSGNRQFGWRVNPIGQIEFYVKGADRMTKWYHNIGAPYGFAQADNLWNSYLSKLVSFVNENGGSGMSNLPITYRLNWQKVKEDLMKDTPISIISCE